MKIKTDVPHNFHRRGSHVKWISCIKPLVSYLTDENFTEFVPNMSVFDCGSRKTVAISLKHIIFKDIIRIE